MFGYESDKRQEQFATIYETYAVRRDGIAARSDSESSRVEAEMESNRVVRVAVAVVVAVLC